MGLFISELFHDLLNRLRGLKKGVDVVENEAGAAVGTAENAVHGPLYPVCFQSWVVSGSLWRGSWPNSRQLKELARSGARTIVNLCSEREQDGAVRLFGMVPVNIPIRDNATPTEEDVARFLAFFPSAGRVPVECWPVYVHCEAGIGRTGSMVAAFRVRCQGWTPAAALEEAEQFGLAMPDQKAWILAL